MGDQVGTQLELDVTGIAHGGIQVARHEGRVVFVTDAIPGERVLARVSDDRKKSFWRADTVRVLTPSEHRRAHVWGAAAIDRDPDDRAGGAEFGHIALAHQRELKRQVLVEAFARFAGQDVDTLLRAAAGDDGPDAGVRPAPGDDDADGLGWRTRVRLHVDADGTAGPYASRSHHVVHVDDLPLATSALADGAPLGRAAMPGTEVVDVLAPSVGGVRLVIDTQAPSVITEQVGDRAFRLDDTGFWQVHHAAPAVLSAAVQRAVDPDRVDPTGHHLDLYGGVGLLAAALGDVVGGSFRVTSVESAPTATEHASANLAEWVGARAETGRVDRWLRRTLATASRADRERLATGTVVLDPPRSGAGRDVVEAIVELAPAQVVYVACDPVALARDTATFADLGWRLDALEAHDLFPHTHHVEAVARFVPAGS